MRTKAILVALFVISLTMMGVILWHHAGTAVSAQPKYTILVAAEPLQSGILLRAEDVKWQLSSGPVAPGAILRPSDDERKAKSDADGDALKKIYGGVVRRRVDTGQPIFSNLIVQPGDRGFLAAVLTPGYRAVDISVTAVSSAAGLIFPGDHVDVILTQSFSQGEEPLPRRVVGETIVSDLRVLAMDQQLQQGSPDAKPSGEYGAQTVHTVTLEVLPKQAEMISVATELGKLSLTLRNVPLEAEPGTTASQAEKPLQPTWAVDVSPALRAAPKAAMTEVSAVHIMRGAKTEDVKD